MIQSRSNYSHVLIIFYDKGEIAAPALFFGGGMDVAMCHRVHSQELPPPPPTSSAAAAVSFPYIAGWCTGTCVCVEILRQFSPMFQSICLIDSFLFFFLLFFFLGAL
jgi:hypothetical protein